MELLKALIGFLVDYPIVIVILFVVFFLTVWGLAAWVMAANPLKTLWGLFLTVVLTFVLMFAIFGIIVVGLLLLPVFWTLTLSILKAIVNLKLDGWDQVEPFKLPGSGFLPALKQAAFFTVRL